MKSKLLKMAEQRPDEVNQVHVNNDGSMVCHVPINFIKIRLPRKVSEEQAAAASERFKQMWEEKRAGESDE